MNRGKAKAYGVIFTVVNSTRIRKTPAETLTDKSEKRIKDRKQLLHKLSAVVFRELSPKFIYN